MKKTFAVLSLALFASPFLAPLAHAERDLTDAEFTSMTTHYGRALNTWYDVRESCGEGDAFRGSQASVRSVLADARAAATQLARALEAFRVAGSSAALRGLGANVQWELYTSHLAPFASSLPSLDGHLNGIQLWSFIQTARSEMTSLGSLLDHELANSRAIVAYQAERNGCVRASLESGGVCTDPSSAIAGAAPPVRAAMSRLRQQLSRLAGRVQCLRSEEEIRYIARRTATLSAPEAARSELPNTLAGEVIIGDHRCETLSQIAGGIPELVSGVNAALVSGRHPTEQAVVSQWIAEHAIRHSGDTSGMGPRLNDFLARIAAQDGSTPAE